MPFYDLHCEDCGKEHNIKATITEKTEKQIACPDCGSRNMTSVFKSANFYVNGLKEKQECKNSSICGSSCPHAR